ncbi:HEAT repeat domain-containing protein [Nocardia sp. MDA0666]|jgi:HEAT repeat protein|uniref:HEAT repeat domain-containing protein n=1 Tax=Nocardia sp. MDA0666 TaxID=2135448 RepID=UPI002688144A
MSARLLALMELADECPEIDDLHPFFADPDPEVRRTALSVLSETTEEWDRAAPIIAAGLADPDRSVRKAAIGLLTELVEVLVPSPEFDAVLADRTGAEEPDVRAAAVEARWRHRRIDATELSALLTDPDTAVRRAVVGGLTSLDALSELDTAAADADPLVRIAVAKGLAAVGDPRGARTLMALAGDPEPLVRAAALNAFAQTGCDDAAAELAASALTDPAWQVRQGAAVALSAAAPEFAAAHLVPVIDDENLDVRKAVVRGLAERIAARREVTDALHTALEDPDADVRAFARIGIANARKEK